MSDTKPTGAIHDNPCSLILWETRRGATLKEEPWSNSYFKINVIVSLTAIRKENAGKPKAEVEGCKRCEGNAPRYPHFEGLDRKVLFF